jgi:hypothetical protein
MKTIGHHHARTMDQRTPTDLISGDHLRRFAERANSIRRQDDVFANKLGFGHR